MIRTFASTKEGMTRFVKPESPSYYNYTRTVLFPFSYSNQVLDISYEGNNFEELMVDISGSPRSEPDTAIRILSGPRLATSLGPTFKAYIRSWFQDSIDAGSPIEVTVPPQVVRVQEANLANITTDDVSWRRSTSPPESDNFITGSVATEFGSTYVFKTPLTFTIVEGGVTNYVTFKTVMDRE